MHTASLPERALERADGPARPLAAATPLAGTSLAPPRALALGHLRAFCTVLVLIHHAVLAYHPYAPAPEATLSPSLVWSAFPVV
ncbi:MAG: hypothetical protein JST92_00860, partial [Deltaproteobacteria bacterium]|nr:hypothetical protein [Deltaproteobacteria bacterium]